MSSRWSCNWSLYTGSVGLFVFCFFHNFQKRQKKNNHNHFQFVEYNVIQNSVYIEKNTHLSFQSVMGWIGINCVNNIIGNNDMISCVCFSNSCSTLRVPRAETRLTVYRSSYIPVRWYLVRLFSPRFLVTIDKSCIVKPTIMILSHWSSLSRFKIILK